MQLNWILCLKILLEAVIKVSAGTVGSFEGSPRENLLPSSPAWLLAGFSSDPVLLCGGLFEFLANRPVIGQVTCLAGFNQSKRGPTGSQNPFVT